MTLPPGYIRVTKSRQCPICEKPDWCLLHRDGTRVVCARTPSAKPFGDAGWVHDIDATHAEPIKFAPAKQTVGIDITGMASRFEQSLHPDEMIRLAMDLGVQPVSLDRLRVGWSKGDGAFTFPMRDAGGVVVGIRLRAEDGRKWSVRGGKEGLFYDPHSIREDILYIVEGPTDTAALLDLGVAAIGRPSCTGGVEHLRRLIKARHHVVIVADHDGPGVRGAQSLADECDGVCRSVKVIEPLKGKDIREWKALGLSVGALRRVVDNSIVWTTGTPGRSSASRSTSAATGAAATASTRSCAAPA